MRLHLAGMAEAPVIRFGCFDGAPEVLRKSTILRRAREKGMHEAAAELERVAAMFPECPHHGKLEDPIVGHVGTQIAICCPWCSDPKVLAAWEAEDHLFTRTVREVARALGEP